MCYVLDSRTFSGRRDLQVVPAATIVGHHLSESIKMHRLVLLIALFVCSAGESEAATYTFEAQSVGTYFGSRNEQGFYTLGNAGIADFRNFAIFDLTDFSGTAIAVTLRSNSGDDAGRNHDIEIFMRSYGGSIPALTAGTANFDELATGTPYANMVFPAVFPDNSPVAFSFNGIGVADVNSAAGGLFAVAGNQPFPTGTTGFFGDNPAGEVILEIETTTIPEPNSMAAIFGLIVTAVLKHRRKRDS